MRTETQPFTFNPGLDPGLQSPDTIQDWMVLESFRALSEQPEINGQQVTWLLSDRVLCVDGSDNEPNNTDWHISVAMTERATAVCTTISSIDPSVEPKDAGTNVRHHYVYNGPDAYDERPSFVVFASNGSSIIELPVENVSSTHTGSIDVRGINGTYSPENESMDITCLEDRTGYRHTIRINKATGDGLVQFDQKSGGDIGWVLNPDESDAITRQLRNRKAATPPDFSRVAVGAAFEQVAA